MSIKNHATTFILPLLVCILAATVLTTPAGAQNTGPSPAPIKRCLLGPGLTDCSSVAAAIRAAGHNPDDPTKCFKVMNTSVTVLDCTQPPFSTGTVTPPPAPPGGTPAPGGTTQVPGAGQGAQRENCDSPESCARNITIIKYLNAGINFLSALVAVVVVIVIIIGGIQYSAAGGNPQATAAAKHRIINAVLALVAYLFLFVFLQWLTPGGL